MALGIAGFKRLNRFKKAYRSLPKNIREEVADALKDLKKPKIPSGRQVKPMRGYHNPRIWEVRLTQNFRMTFEMQDDIAVLRNVGSHNILNEP